MALRLGVALEGGGARCAAQAGALAALSELGILPSYYAGCGAGALVAALAATGTLSEQAVLNFQKALCYSGFLRERRLHRLLRDTFGESLLRDTPPVAMPTVDLETGAVQVLASMLPVRPDPRPWSRQSLVAGAVRAAMATPGALPPVRWRGRRLLGGGMLRGTLPTILRTMGAERVLVVRVLDAGCAAHETHPAAQAICACAMVAMPPPPCDICITVTGYAPDQGVLDPKTVRLLWDAGRAAALRALPALREMLGDHDGKILPFPGEAKV